MELNLRLDEQGRTTFDPSTDHSENTSNKPNESTLDYQTTTHLLPALAECDDSLYDEILLDCEVSP